jgi:hypothetical protein
VKGGAEVLLGLIGVVAFDKHSDGLVVELFDVGEGGASAGAELPCGPELAGAPAGEQSGRVETTAWQAPASGLDGGPDLGVGYEIRLDSGPDQQQEDGRAAISEPVAGCERMVALVKPAGRPNSDTGELEGSVWEVGERACAVGREASAYEQAGHKKIRRHEHVGERAGRAMALGVDEPKRERPKGAERVVGGDGEHAREGGGRIVGGGEREVEQAAGKHGATGQDRHEQGGGEREPRQAHIGQEPSAKRIRRAHGSIEAQDCGSHWDTTHPPGTEASRANVT